MKRKTTDAVEILHHLYYEGNPERLASLEEEWVKADIAQEIYDLREAAGLTHKQLAERAGVTEDIIRDLEDTDYDADVFQTLYKVVKALNSRIEVRVTPLKTEAGLKQEAQPQAAIS